MIIGTKQRITFSSGRKLSSKIPIEFVVAAILNPRFSAAVQAVYGYDYRLIADEIHQILRLHRKDKIRRLQSDSEYDSELTESDVEPKLSEAMNGLRKFLMNPQHVRGKIEVDGLLFIRN